MPATGSQPKESTYKAPRGESSPIDHRYIGVKFKDSLKLPRYADNLERYFEESDSPEWKAIARLAPGATFRRVYRTLTPEQIDELSARATHQNPEYKPPQFLKNYLLDLPPSSPVTRVLEVLRDWKDVDRAYRAPQVADPAVNADDDPEAAFQWYLDPAPLGIDARYAWLQQGGDGVNQEIIDIEGGWTLDHEDLLDSAPDPVPRPVLLAGVIVPGSCSHGTKVLGVICATDNDKGCVGIAPNTTTIAVISHGGYAFNIPEAIKIADRQLSPGGVILLEVSLRVREGTPLLPAEIDPLVLEEIQLATALGLIVVEAAGNGNFPLDTYGDVYRIPFGKQIFDRNSPNFLNSGAIMVGSGYRPDTLAGKATPWSRRLDSNYGTRVDCFAWGDSVQTLGSTSENPRSEYEFNFDGTSSAAAIIAGAALCLQGMAQAISGARLTPDKLRGMLTDAAPAIPATPATPGVLANTPTADPAQDQIGVMPNLRAIHTKWPPPPPPV